MHMCMSTHTHIHTHTHTHPLSKCGHLVCRETRNSFAPEGSVQTAGLHTCVCAKLLQSCPTLCSLMGCSLPSSLSMGFSRQESWSRLPFPFPGDLLNLGIKLTSPTSQADSSLLSHQGSLLLHFIAVYFIAIATWYKSE